jgi:signal transduction histidine kinase
VVVESVHRGVPTPLVLGNAAAYGLFALAGSVAIGAALGGHPPTARPATVLFAIIALLYASEIVTFAYVAVSRGIYFGDSIRRSIRQTLLPLTAFYLVTGAFTGAAAVVYLSAGLGALATVLALVLVSGRLMKAVALVEERGQQVAELATARARLLAEALTTEERERVRLAGEIHDDALQELALAQLDLRAADRDPAALERGRRSLDSGIASIRGTLSRIVPAAEMRSVGLESALEALAADLCGPAGLRWDVAVHPSVADCDRTLVCSLARELVTNVVKHADASRVEIRIAPVGKGVRLEVADDGRGFVPAAPSAGHVGLALVENRARAADGRLEIHSVPGSGTVSVVELHGHR